MKKNPDPDEHRAKAARQVTRTLYILGSCQDIATGARTPAGSVVKICNQYKVIDDLDSNADNRIIGTAIKLREEGTGQVILVSTDGLCGAQHKPSYAEPIVMRRGQRQRSQLYNYFNRGECFSNVACSA